MVSLEHHVAGWFNAMCPPLFVARWHYFHDDVISFQGDVLCQMLLLNFSSVQRNARGDMVFTDYDGPILVGLSNCPSLPVADTLDGQ